MPTTEKAMFSVIIRDIWPEATNERVEELWVRRGSGARAKRAELEASNLTDNFEHADQVLDPSDVAEVEEIVKAAREKPKTQACRDDQESVAGGGGDGIEGKPNRRGFCQTIQATENDPQQGHEAPLEMGC